MVDYHLPVYVPGLRCVQSEVTDHIHISPHLSKSIVMTSLFCISVTGSRYVGGSSAWLVTMIVTFCNREELELSLWQRHNQTYIFVTLIFCIKHICEQLLLLSVCGSVLFIFQSCLKVSISSIHLCHDLKLRLSQRLHHDMRAIRLLYKP